MTRTPRRLLPPALALLLGLGMAVELYAPALAQIDAWVDPGHGGKDPGALGIDGPAAPNEEDFNLQVSTIVQSRLGQIGWLALLTRNSDIYWTKTRRTLIAAGLRPNDQGDQEPGTCCASVHMNSVGDTTVFGSKVIFPALKMFAKSRRAYGPDSSFGAYVKPALLSNTALAFMGCNRDLGLTRDVRSLTVLQKSRVPTVIVECCLISNRCQFDKIKVQSNQALVANGIATGVANYLGSLAPNLAASGAPSPPIAGAPYSLTTPPVGGVAQVQAAALQEGFEGGTFPPAGWTLQSSGANQPYTWHRSTDSLYVAVGSGAAVVQGESPATIDEWLISPMFRVALTDTTLRFRWLSNPFYANSANALCAVRPKGLSTWTDVWTLESEPQSVAFRYPSRAASLTPWLGDSVQVAFRVNGTSGPDVAIDDVSTGVFALTAPPANDICQAATPLPAGTFTISGTTCYAADNRNPFPADSTVSSCVPDEASGGDVFYSVNAQVGDTLSVASTDKSTYRPLLYLLNSCDSLTASCVAGEGDADSDEAPSFHYIIPSSGTYYLVVDAIPDECGDFELAITFRGAVTGVDADAVPVGLHLAAMPNPSHGVVRFSGTAPLNSSIQGMLSVLDLSGRLLFKRQVTASNGRFEVFWDGRLPDGHRLASGIYHARLTVGGESATTQVVVLE